MITIQRLPAILDAQIDLIEKIAESWITVGAAHVGLWDGGNDQPYILWEQSADTTETQTTFRQIRAVIEVEGYQIANLLVFGPNKVVQRHRVRLDAEFIATRIQNSMLREELQALRDSLVAVR